MEISKLVTYGLIVTFLVLLTVGDTVLIAILMYCFNRNNPPNCDYQCSGNLTCDSVRSNLFVFMPFYRISRRCCVCICSILTALARSCWMARSSKRARPLFIVSDIALLPSFSK